MAPIDVDIAPKNAGYFLREAARIRWLRRPGAARGSPKRKSYDRRVLHSRSNSQNIAGGVRTRRAFYPTFRCYPE
ncbi:hypothetical protein BDY21DRAFT_334884 [Lineolata rhizophorae]|uniref:Uncharacterized protein n=1 Tax=Lineolata rhizophorae TaxID=578093 RepID=A0A6A6P8D8_9PEZI|nr:hypothetical protein BDY21DRAFT_334884 [Lineolata rhizophorae]